MGLKKEIWQPVAGNREWRKQHINEPAIIDYLEKIISNADSMHKFYFEHVAIKRLLSILIRTFSFILFSGSVFLTALLGFTDDKNELPVLCIDFSLIAFAGILLFADRSFGFSETWMRYTQARFELEKIVADFHAQVIKLFEIDDSGKSIKEFNSLLVDLLLDFDKSLRKVIVDETSEWSSNLKLQIKTLSDRVDAELTSRKQLFEKRQAEYNEERKIKLERQTESSKDCYLIVSFAYSSIEDGFLTINEVKHKINKNQDSKVISHIPRGICAVLATINIGGKIINTETVVDLKDGINRINIGKENNQH